jgi:3-hydroxybutyryl-CoA dehydrogenase
VHEIKICPLRRIDLERIAVIGSGLMGHGIAQAFAVQGHPVVIQDISPAALAGVIQRVKANLRALGIPEAAAGNIKLEDSLHAAVKGADFVIETVSENLELKQRIFTELASLTHSDCVLASNTSVIPIGGIASSACIGGIRLISFHWLRSCRQRGQIRSTSREPSIC